MLLAALAVAGCGGSTSDASTPAPIATVVLSPSNLDLAARAAANATVGSANVVDVNPAAGSNTSAAEAVQARSAQERLLTLTRRFVVERVLAKGSPASSGTPRALGLITRTDSCAAGGSVAGALDDRDNSGAASAGDVLTVTFVNCKPNVADLIDGTVSASYVVVRSPPNISVSATVTYAQLQASSTEGTTRSRAKASCRCAAPTTGNCC